MTSPLIRWALVLALVLNAASLHGQTTEEPAPEPAAPATGLRLAGAGGFRYGPPLGPSLYAGVILSDQTPDFIDGPSLFGEVGLDGVRVSVGHSTVSLGGTARVQLSVIRTWDNHGDIKADQTYVGPEIVGGLLAGLSVGYYWRITDGGGKARILAIGSFIGL